MFSVITLDLDDTLWDNKPTLKYAEKKLYEWLQEHSPVITSEFSSDELTKHRTELAKQRPELSHDMSKLRYQSLSDIAHRLGVNDIADKAMSVFLHARNNVTLFDDVIPFLDAVYRDYQIVALSNGNADVNAIGLGDYFSLTLSPADVGVAKPDPAMFFSVFEQLNVLPEALLHIGDEPSTDVLGAHRAGVRKVWINRNNASFPSNISRPDLEISSLKQLIPLPSIL